MPVYVKSGGTWRETSQLYVRDATSYTNKTILNGYIKQSGTWEEFYTLFNTPTSFTTAGAGTTNAIVPGLDIFYKKFGINGGNIETVHSYTNDQNLIDNFHKGDRRGRSAALNMVITSTGAVKAVSKALPELEGKLTGNAIRVPTPNVSLAILSLAIGKETTKDDPNNYLRSMAFHSD